MRCMREKEKWGGRTPGAATIASAVASNGKEVFIVVLYLCGRAGASATVAIRSA